MRYKHISDLNTIEKNSLFNKYDDLVNIAVERVIEKHSESDYNKINHNTIKREFDTILKEMDEVIDIENYNRYILK